MTAKCGVCWKPLEDHEDLHHEFTITDKVIPKTSKKTTSLDLGMVIRLVEVLHAKSLITDLDVHYVFPDLRLNFRSSPDSGDLPPRGSTSA